MNMWTIARIEKICGNCRQPIAIGEKCLKFTFGTTESYRCQSCGETFRGEPAPEVTEEPEAQGLDVRHQPSFDGFHHVPMSAGSVTTAELARRRAANHFANRGRR